MLLALADKVSAALLSSRLCAPNLFFFIDNYPYGRTQDSISLSLFSVANLTYGRFKLD